MVLVFTPNEGVLHPHSEIPITVTVYNNACGKFDDVFVSSIRGLPEYKFPVSINISGSPLVIPENQVGLNYNTIPATIPFPQVVDNSPAISKFFKVKNTGISDIGVTWKMFDMRPKEIEEEGDMLQVKINPNNGFDAKENPFKLSFNMFEPEESFELPYEVEPKDCIVPSKGSKTFEVKFNSDQGIGELPAVLMAKPTQANQDVDPDDEEKIEAMKRPLGTVALNLAAKTIDPYLVVDKKKR